MLATARKLLPTNTLRLAIHYNAGWQIHNICFPSESAEGLDVISPRILLVDHISPMNQTERHREFVDLLVEHQNRLFAYLFALLHSRDDAEEVYQQTSLVLWRKFDTFEPGTNFFRWAAQIAQFEVLNYLKSRRRSRLRFSDEVVEQLAAVAPELEADPADERRDALAGCLDKLKPEDRQLVTDCYGNQVTVRDLAERLGRPQTSVHNSLRRIRQWLMDCIERTLAAEGRP